MADRILVTGAGGFIGAHVLARLLANGQDAIGLDSFNDYYDVSLKRDRVQALVAPVGGTVESLDCADAAALRAFFERHGIRRVVHLAAQAGVRYSLVNPQAYVASNLVGFANMLECCRHAGVEHLVYASSSSVYGRNARLPWDEGDMASHPVSLYAATKGCNELLAHSYAHLYGFPCTGLRFFTVYGPWGRPDMAPMLFARAILAGEAIKVFNHGRMQRDFTYIDDIAQAVCGVLDKPATPDEHFSRADPRPATSEGPHRVFNIGNHQPVSLLGFIETLERALGRRTERDFQPMQAGDVPSTYAATERLNQWIGFAPSTPLEQGIERFVAWYRPYHFPSQRNGTS